MFNNVAFASLSTLSFPTIPVLPGTPAMLISSPSSAHAIGFHFIIGVIEFVQCSLLRCQVVSRESVKARMVVSNVSGKLRLATYIAFADKFG